MDEAIKNIYEILTKNGKELNIQPVKSSVLFYSDFEEKIYSVTNYSQFSLLDSGLVFALGEGESTGGMGGYDSFNFADIALI